MGRLRDDDEGAAEVGITETTREPKAYDHPTNPKIKFWDLPGIGTPNYADMATYCKKVELERFHAFLILTAGRLTENDLKLAWRSSLHVAVPILARCFSRKVKSTQVLREV